MILAGMDHTTDLRQVPIETVHREFVSEDFLRAFATEVGVVVEGIDLQEKDGLTIARMPWSFPTDRPGIPTLARKLLPGEVRLDWQQQWGSVAQGRADGSVQVELHGTPSAQVRGTSSLRTDGTGTRYEVATTTKTAVPWPLGSTVEKTIDKELVGWILQVQVRVLLQRTGAAGAGA
jgi:hypothetical protein